MNISGPMTTLNDVFVNEESFLLNLLEHIRNVDNL